MNLLVDTSVWSHAMRRTPPMQTPEVERLEACLQRGDIVVTTCNSLNHLLCISFAFFTGIYVFLVSKFIATIKCL